MKKKTIPKWRRGTIKRTPSIVVMVVMPEIGLEQSENVVSVPAARVTSPAVVAYGNMDMPAVKKRVRSPGGEDTDDGIHVESVPVARVTDPVVEGAAADGIMDVPAAKT